MTGKRTDQVLRCTLLMSSFLSLLVIGGIFAFLFYFASPLFHDSGWLAIMSFNWRPFQGEYGILAIVGGSLCLTATAMILAYPVGVGVCLFINGLAPKPAARTVTALVQFMAGIPTVIYGFVAAFTLVPFIRGHFQGGTGFSWLTASLILSLLTLPTIILILNSYLHRIREDLLLTCCSLGITKPTALVRVILPASRPGLIAAGILGFGRAMGDTLIALMLTGNAPQLPDSFFDSIRVLTAHIALVVATDSQSSAYHSIFASGLILFGLTALINLTLLRLNQESGTSHGLT